LTPWLDIKLNLASLIPLFKTLPQQNPLDSNKRPKLDTVLPSGPFGQVTYVRIYANCRLRRIWFVSGPYLACAELTCRAPMEREHLIKLGSKMSGLYMLLRT
jgi:hypothetical protein